MNKSLDELQNLYLGLNELDHYVNMYSCLIFFPDDMFHKTTNGRDFTMDINTIMPAKFETHVQKVSRDIRDSRDKAVFHYDSSKMTVICLQCIPDKKNDEVAMFFTLRSSNGNYFKQVDHIKHFAGVLTETRTYVCHECIESAISYYFADSTQKRMSLEEAFGITPEEA
jgi:hypothetical protein